MQVVILCNNRSKEELLDQKIDAAGFTWIDDRKDFPSHANAAVCMDLLFENKEEERHLLQQLLPRLTSVPGVSQAFMQGAPPREVTVWIDPQRCAEAGIQPGQVVADRFILGSGIETTVSAMSSTYMNAISSIMEGSEIVVE